MDWNGDGNRDMLVGGFGGDIMYYQGQPDGKFAAGTHLRFENGEYFLHRPILTENLKKTSPNEDILRQNLDQDDSAAGIWVTDWDGDGDLDIVSGWFFGGLFVSRNNGTPTDPQLSAEFEIIYAGGEPLKEVFQSEPVIADWDGDGRDDLIYGTREGVKKNPGAIYWCRNTSDRGDPVYEAPRKLVDSGSESQYLAPWIDRDRIFGSALTLSVIDWEGDGDLDLLVGDYSMTTLAKDGITAEQYDELVAMDAQAVKLRKQMLDSREDAEAYSSAQKELMAVYKAQEKYKVPTGPRAAKKDRPDLGRVWLLIRD